MSPTSACGRGQWGGWLVCHSHAPEAFPLHGRASGRTNAASSATETALGSDRTSQGSK